MEAWDNGYLSVSDKSLILTLDSGAESVVVVVNIQGAQSRMAINSDSTRIDVATNTGIVCVENFNSQGHVFNFNSKRQRLLSVDDEFHRQYLHALRGESGTNYGIRRTV